MQLTADEQKDCLAYYPFADDFGVPGDRVFTDKVVVTRSSKDRCHICGQPSKPKEHARILVMYCGCGGGLRHYRWCLDCCKAMAAWTNDDQEPLLEKYRCRRSK